MNYTQKHFSILYKQELLFILYSLFLFAKAAFPFQQVKKLATVAWYVSFEVDKDYAKGVSNP